MYHDKFVNLIYIYIYKTRKTGDYKTFDIRISKYNLRAILKLQ